MLPQLTPRGGPGAESVAAEVRWGAALSGKGRFRKGPSGCYPKATTNSKAATDHYANFERRRHRIHPPGLFDEGDIKIDKLAPLASAATWGDDLGTSGYDGQRRRMGGIIEGGLLAHQGSVTIVDDEDDGDRKASNANQVSPDRRLALGVQKAHFFDRCLRADRAVERPKVLAGASSPVNAAAPGGARPLRRSSLGEDYSVFEQKRPQSQSQSPRAREHRASPEERVADAHPASPAGEADVLQEAGSSPGSPRMPEVDLSHLLAPIMPQSDPRFPHSDSDPDSDGERCTLNKAVNGFVNSCKHEFIHPATTGIIRVDESKLQLEYGCMTDRRAKAAVQTLRATSSGVKEALMRSNNLSEEGAKHLLSALPDKVLRVDLSENELGHSDIWCPGLKRLKQLRSLELSNCGINDSVCKTLCDSLMSVRNLRSLNFSGNKIYMAAREVGNLVGCQAMLEELDMHWNHATGDGGRELVRSFMGHGRLHTVNLSWNPLGKVAGDDICKLFAQTFAENKVLKHLDLSNCDLREEQCRLMAEGLKENRTLLGLHMAGNDGRLCPRGFIEPFTPLPRKSAKRGVHAAAEGVSPRTASATTSVGLDHAAEQAAKQQSAVPVLIAAATEEFARGFSIPEIPDHGCCWMCDNWRETRFCYTPGISGPADVETVWLFTSVDNFSQPTKMTRHGGQFVTYIMTPPGIVGYLLQAGAEILASRTANLFVMSKAMPHITIRRQDCPGEGGDDSGDASPSDEQRAASKPSLPQEVSPRAFSCKFVAARPAGEDVCKWSIVRRPGHLNGIPDEIPRWAVSESIFAPRGEPLARRSFCERCLDADWGNSNASLLTADSDDRGYVKDLFRAHYADIKCLYASLCSWDWHPSGRAEDLAFGMSVWEFTHFLAQHNLLGDEVLPLPDADAHFIIASMPVKEQENRWMAVARRGGRVLLRHGFLELLLRLALAVFAQQVLDPDAHLPKTRKRAETAGEALNLLLDKHIIFAYPPMKNNFKCLQWRSDVLQTEDVDQVFRKHMKLVEQIFTGYSQEASDPSAQRYLRPVDWFSLLDQLHVLPCSRTPSTMQERMNSWDRAWLWQVSISSFADELTSSRHLQLVFVDFLEALARLLALSKAREQLHRVPQAEKDKWDCGVDIPSPACAFAADRESLQDPEGFAERLDEFLGSEAIVAVATRLSQTEQKL
eukprot:TRINITY_DN104613_c0_g1_i1.p1 TRINITY_DN104613_c0_g1~~TRINITY_DN104613_c0_g1_i1.p1  ORF type:complete len:1184 (-),score=215.60 TRINITY_DN104613_c0_g1_i1:81-3632(-)